MTERGGSRTLKHNKRRSAVKVYFHLNIMGFSNCYTVVNEKTMEALIIDPGQVTSSIIEQLEAGKFKLVAVLITHNHGSHAHGISTLTKIYSPRIYGADASIVSSQANVITGDGKLRIAGFLVTHIAIPGHTIDSMMYKIGNVIFTGDAITAGSIGSTSSSYSRAILKENLCRKLLSQNENTILMPGHGPPTTIGVERVYNAEVAYKDFHVGLFSQN